MKIEKIQLYETIKGRLEINLFLLKYNTILLLLSDCFFLANFSKLFDLDFEDALSLSKKIL